MTHLSARTVLRLLIAGVVVAACLASRPRAVVVSRTDSAPPASSFSDPWALALSRSGADLYVACQPASRVKRLSTATGAILADTAVGETPASLVLDEEHGTLFVLCRNRFSVEVLATPALARKDQIEVDPFPVAGHLARRGPGDRPALFVAQHHLDQVTVIDPSGPRLKARIVSGKGPVGLFSSPSGDLLLCSSYFNLANDFLKTPAAELTGIDVRAGRAAFRLAIPGATLLRPGAFLADGSAAFFCLQRSKNLVPNVAVDEGWSMSHGLGVLVRKPGAPELTAEGWEVRQVLLDGLMEGNAEPYQLALSPDGRRAYVICLGGNSLLVLDVPRLLELVRALPADELEHRQDLLDRFLLARVALPAGPRAMAVGPDGRVFIACSLAESIAVIEPAKLALGAVWPLGPARENPAVRHGEQLFRQATQSHEGRLSCNSCHPESHHDGLTYDIAADGLGKNRVRIKTLLGASGTEPFKWSGLNAGYYAQCGPRASRLIMHMPAYPPADLDDLVAYLKSLALPPNPYLAADGRLTPAQKRGQVLFERKARANGTPIKPEGQCAFCHAGPRFTVNREFDVGTRTASDAFAEVDTPQLENLFMARPFLHDGAFATLEEVFTTGNPDDRHGVANDLDKGQLNDLVEYMRGLGPRPAPVRTGKTLVVPDAPRTARTDRVRAGARP